MAPSGSAAPVVLVVEDERNLADLYGTWLEDSYDVRIAYDADAATDQMDEDVDVVLLDRRLPGMSGDEFLEYVSDRYDCQVAMVSAVDPDFDILEMGFDDYVVKPVERGDLQAVVERLLSLEETDPDTQEYFSLIAKKEALEAEKTTQELGENAEYADLLQSIERFRKHVIALAEGYLESEATVTVGGDRKIYEMGIQEWEQRKREISENDPLHRTAEEEIRKYEELLEEMDRGSAAARELLEIVADSFVAEGFWLDVRVRRALNKILFGKDSETLVIQRKKLESGNNLSTEQVFEISQTVREKAADERQSMD
jgi:DNA-binding response OmpR family regulator